MSSTKFTRVSSGPKIILLDLQSTLTANFGQMRNNPKPARIRDEEQYRPYLVDWLRTVQQRGWEIHLFTVRRVDRRDATLESILTKTGWGPDESWFKNAETGSPPEVKSAFLDRLIPTRNPSALYALESNDATRRMFKARGIPCQRISTADDLPPLSQFS